MRTMECNSDAAPLAKTVFSLPFAGYLQQCPNSSNHNLSKILRVLSSANQFTFSFRLRLFFLKLTVDRLEFVQVREVQKIKIQLE